MIFDDTANAIVSSFNLDGISSQSFAPVDWEFFGGNFSLVGSSTVPEPGTAALLGLGLAALARWRAGRPNIWVYFTTSAIRATSPAAIEPAWAHTAAAVAHNRVRIRRAAPRFWAPRTTTKGAIDVTMKNGVIALLAGLVVCMGSASAQAGGALVNFYPFDIKGTLLVQDVNKKGEDVVTKQKFKATDIGAVCLGVEKLGKTQKVFLRYECTLGENGTEGEIWVVNTDPVALLEMIGTVDMDLNDAINTTKKGVITSITANGTVDIACDEGGDSIDLQSDGLFVIKVDDLAGNLCPVSFSTGSLVGDGIVDLVGVGPGPDVLLDKTSASAKKPAAGFILP